MRRQTACSSPPGATETFAQLGRYLENAVDDDIVLPQLAALADELPVVIVWGANETAFPVSMATEAHAALPSSELVVRTGVTQLSLTVPPARQ